MTVAKAKTIADFRATHDPDVKIPARIKTALEAMLKEGPEQWEYELDFAKRAQLNSQQLRDYRERFKDHILVAAGDAKRNARNVWFADARVAKKLRGD